MKERVLVRYLIIGGSDAGISAALRIKETDSKSEVAVLVADAFANFSICGLPFYLNGVFTSLMRIRRSRSGIAYARQSAFGCGAQCKRSHLTGGSLTRENHDSYKTKESVRV